MIDEDRNEEYTMDEPSLDPKFAAAVQQYHRPPRTIPREQMWEAIVAQRSTMSVDDKSLRGSVRIRQFPQRLTVRWVAVGMVAAVVCIGIGVAIGVRLPQRSRPHGAPALNRVAQATPTAPLQVVTEDHFAQAAALLTAVHDAGPHTLNSDVLHSTEDLLSKTRLLMDSPAALNPQQYQLLQDLEFILVQLTQLPPSAGPRDRAPIVHAMRQDHMLMRLRQASPQGI